jgi:phospholipase/lecithinase/hemolysin
MRIKAWNSNLIEYAQKFSEKHGDVRVRIYDAAALFTRVLDDPKKYGFKDSTSKFMLSDAEEESCIWYDDLHPTSAMHKILAADLARFLTEEEFPERSEKGAEP